MGEVDLEKVEAKYKYCMMPPGAWRKLIDEIERLRERPPCTWSDDEEPIETSCGNSFVFISDGIEENGFRFCPYCGNKIARAALHTEGEVSGG